MEPGAFSWLPLSLPRWIKVSRPLISRAAVLSPGKSTLQDLIGSLGQAKNGCFTDARDGCP